MDPAPPTVALTYKDDGNQDGICSQLLRIYGIYALSRFIRVPYYHSPIAHLGYHGLNALEENAPRPNLLGDVNRVFNIPSDLDISDRRVVTHDMDDADINEIRAIANIRDGATHLIRVLYPFPVTDSHPEIYRFLEPVCPFRHRGSDVFRLGIHVRRGECHTVAPDWILPNAYYISCALRFQKVLQNLGIPFVCELYTEIPTKTFEITPSHHGIGGRIEENFIYDPAIDRIEEFDQIPNLEKFINTDPIESLERLTTADALIISHSSFSYLPAVFRADRIVVYHPYWRGRMRHWLTSGDDGSISEEQLAIQLAEWKAACETTQTHATSVSLGAEKLRKPFIKHSASIRTVVTHRAPGMAEGASTIEFPAQAPGAAVQPAPVTVSWEAQGLNELSQLARDLSGSEPGYDLLVVPAHLLNQPLEEEFAFRAVAAIFPDTVTPHDEAHWRLRRALFDRGLICIGSVRLQGGRALCFLTSQAVRSFNHLDIEPRGHVILSLFTEDAGFANQLWRYAFVKLYALRHGLTPAIKEWQGRQFYGLEDETCAGLEFPMIEYPGFAKNDREPWECDHPPIDVDFRGYFQEIPECWRKHRNLLRHMFQLSPERVRVFDAWYDAVTRGGRRTLVAVSVRRGDYVRLQNDSLPWFRLVPLEWYLAWLRDIWPSLRDPLLYVATDEPTNVVPAFSEYLPLTAESAEIPVDLPRHIREFEVLRRADYLAICNSSFPRFAAILAPAGQKCFLPSFRTRSFAPYEAWMDPNFWVRFEDRPEDDPNAGADSIEWTSGNPKRVENLEFRAAEDGVFVARLGQAERQFFLNPTAALIFELCDGENSPSDIVSLIHQAYDLPGLPVQQVLSTLKQLQAQGLLS